MKVPRKRWLALAGVGTLSLLELVLRAKFGLGHPVLLQADPETGYRYQPNQNLVRLGKRIRYNQFSQRSEAVALSKLDGFLRILMVGDSVLNGGSTIDQSEIITEQLEDRLRATGQRTEVLNASAKSWGIGNQLGYLNEFGVFDSDRVIVQIGTSDLTQPTSTSDPVGKQPDYPDHLPLLAIQELIMRYLWPRIHPGSLAQSSAQPVDPDQQFAKNMQDLQAIATLVQSQNSRLLVLFTANRADLLPNPQEPPYKAQFFQQLQAMNIPVIDSHAAWANKPEATVETYFQDNIHLTVDGNKAIANLLFNTLTTEPDLSNSNASAP